MHETTTTQAAVAKPGNPPQQIPPQQNPPQQNPPQQTPPLPPTPQPAASPDAPRLKLVQLAATLREHPNRRILAEYLQLRRLIGR